MKLKKTKTQPINIKIDTELWRSVSIRAAEQGMMKRELVENALINYLIKNETKMEKFTVSGQTYEIALTQDAYLTGVNGDPHYEAHAVDADENHYIVRWDILGDYDPADGDEGLACEWNQPVSIEKIY